MAIPASHIVDVQPRVITGGSNNLEFNGLVLSRNETISSDTMVLEFTTARAVGEYFGLTSPEYEAAQVYFTGYVNKFTAPRAFFVARRIDDIASAWVRSAPNTITLAQYQEITDGSINVTIDGQALTITDVDFSTATSLSEVGELLAEAIASNGGDDSGPVVNVIYSSLNRSFTLWSTTLGASSEVSYPTDGATGTGLATLMGFTEARGSVHSSGSAPLSVAEQMAAILGKTENWVSFTTLYEAEADEILEWAAWANANYGWLYVPYTTDPNTPNPDSATDPASQLKDAGYNHTAIFYGGLEYAAFLMGAIACIAWERLNGTVTLAFKRQDGLAATVIDEQSAATLERKNCNYYGNFATRNAEFVFGYEGVLSSRGSNAAMNYAYIDPYINSVWLNNRLQVALMDGLTRTGRLPYNERGYTQIRAWMMDPTNDALNNGAIEPGVVLSEAQKSELFNEAAQDISGELYTQGYFIQILDPGAPVRAQRETPIVNYWYTYGGAIHRIEVASTTIL